MLPSTALRVLQYVWLWLQAGMQGLVIQGGLKQLILDVSRTHPAAAAMRSLVNKL